MRDGMTLAVLALLLSASCSWGCQLTWTAPTTNVDGSPLTNLESYTLYFQPAGSSTPQVEATVKAPATSATVNGACKRGAYTVTAVNSYGLESDPSNEVVVTKPNAPVITQATK